MGHQENKNELAINHWTACLVGAASGYILNNFCNEDEDNSTYFSFKVGYTCLILGYFWIPCFKKQPLSTISSTLAGVFAIQPLLSTHKPPLEINDECHTLQI